MILTDQEIRQALDAGEIHITPFDEHLVKRNSYLLRLVGPFRRIQGDDILDTADPDSFTRCEGTVETGNSVLLTSDSLVLAGSYERVGLAPTLAGLLSGISNVARLGVQVHATSQLVNAGFAHDDPSPLVFELSTVGARQVRLYAGTPICHLILARLSGPAAMNRPSGRSGQRGTDPSQLLRQFGHYYLPAAGRTADIQVDINAADAGHASTTSTAGIQPNPRIRSTDSDGRVAQWRRT
ncbi:MULTISPECIES: dCTP deaminase [unclassified Streptomyces]|uniref:dCTP deaminase n=1 Tax=unclassified Streptomyces TaxID=2593676 RepID=UPI00403D01F3